MTNQFQSSLWLRMIAVNLKKNIWKFKNRDRLRSPLGSNDGKYELMSGTKNDWKRCANEEGKYNINEWRENIWANDKRRWPNFPLLFPPRVGIVYVGIHLRLFLRRHNIANSYVLLCCGYLVQKKFQRRIILFLFFKFIFVFSSNKQFISTSIRQLKPNSTVPVIISDKLSQYGEYVHQANSAVGGKDLFISVYITFYT